MNSSKPNSWPVTYALIAAKSLEKYLIPLYNFPADTLVQFIYQGINDTYLVRNHTEKYILRIYRADWKTKVQVQAELELLLLLKEQGIAVSYPVADRNNQLIHTLTSPDGERYAVMFTYAAGEKIAILEPDQATLFGRLLATIHQATSGKQISNLHRNYGVNNILEGTFSAIQLVLHHDQESCNKLSAVCRQLSKKLNPSVLSQLKQGICHGDPHHENIFIVPASNKITLFDFDFCGNGYLLYDLGSFSFYERNKPENIKAFLAGYAAVLPLSDRERSLIPYFRVLMRLFHVGARSGNADGIKNPLWFPEEIAAKIEDISKELESLP